MRWIRELEVDVSVKKPSITNKAMFALQPLSTPVVGGQLPVQKAKTGPGALVAHMAMESEAIRENEALREELKNWEGASPARRLDSNLVEPSKWANRHKDSFGADEFGRLKEEISNAGGNVQPIKVRPIVGSSPQRYEIVFGHRRHRACLELGIRVLAVVEAITDQALFQEMDRENRLRSDLRPFEQGEMYRRALDEGLFSSLRSLAEAIGVQPGNVSTALQIARLPRVVLEAFPSSLDIQYRWAKPLNDLAGRDLAGLEKRAKSLIADRSKGRVLSAQDVFNELVGIGGRASDNTLVEVKFKGRRVATIKSKGDQVFVEFAKGSLGNDGISRVEKAIKSLFA